MSKTYSSYKTANSVPTASSTDWKQRLFAEDYQDLVTSFNAFDENGTGIIDPSEIKAALEDMGACQTNPFILKLVNGLVELKVPITLDVFIQYMVTEVGDFKTRDGVQKIYNMYDSNCNGFIQQPEFKQVARSIQDCITDDQIYEMIHAVYTKYCTSSTEGLIFDEFYQVVASYTQQ